MEKEEWYKLRNDRINRIDGISLKHDNFTTIGVVINPENINTFSVQIMAYMSLNMLSRWCPSFTIDINENIQCIIPGFVNKTLYGVLKEMVISNDPFGEYFFNKVSLSDFDIVLKVGGANSEENSNLICIDAAGWIAGIGKKMNDNFTKNIRDRKNPIGASFAACLGVSEVFKKYLGNNSTGIKSVWYSISDLGSGYSPEHLENPDFPEVIEIGNTFQIGCGAVGSSLDLLLSFLNVRGIINLIDYDTVSVQNTASSMLFTADDGFQEKDKIYVCKSILDKVDGLNVPTHKRDYSGFVKEMDLLHNYPDRILCLANEKNIWATIQYNFPPLVLHATTSSSWGVNLGRHIPFKDWCIVCRFGIEEYETTPVCSEAKINLGEERGEILGILPFLSAAAAILMLSEIIKSLDVGYGLIKENFFQFSFLGKDSEFIKINIPRKNDCPICMNQTEDDYSLFLNQINKERYHKI